jgi:pimeloyl-ACP methyl ester carboxylesterase
VQRSDGPDVVFDAGGRGFDQDGNGVIAGDEGSRGITPLLSSIAIRDANRQWAIDSFQLVRQIQLGIDFDGDGVPDLDASKIHVLGQSMGSYVAPIVLAVEPAVRTGVLNAGNDSPIEGARLGLNRPFVAMFELAPRKPSLINVGGAGGFEFNENIPLRNLPPVTNTVPGAFAIARMFDAYRWALQSSDASAWAPHIRKRPLPGHSAKPVLLQIAKGDQTVPNPTSTAVIRAGDLADRTMFYRHDLAFAADPTKPKDPHRFLTNNQVASMRSISLATQRQAAVFFASMGATTVDPDDAGPLFEMPIRLPLPETLDFIP